MTVNRYTHSEVADLDVRRAFSSWGSAGRCVQGLLNAAAKKGVIGKQQHSGRVTGITTWYIMTEDQLQAIRAEAVARAAKR